MPSISRCDQDGINVLAVEDFAKVTMQFAVAVSVVFVDQFLALIATVFLHIGHRDALQIGVREHAAQNVATARSNPNNTQ